MPWGFLIPYLHMVKRLSRVLDHAEVQGSGDVGNLGIGDAGAVQIGGVAEAFGYSWYFWVFNTEFLKTFDCFL